MSNGLIGYALGGIEISIQRFEKGAWTGGKLHSKPMPPFTTKAVVQPMTGRDLETLPEGRRQDHVIKLYTDVRLLVSDDHAKERADVLTIDGEFFEVIHSENWQGLGLTHHKAFAARVKN